MNRTLLMSLTLAALILSPIDARADRHAAAAASHEAEDSSVTPKWAYSQLVEGNKRFVDGKATHPAQDEAARRKLVDGQKPYAIVLSCSDSRAAPELVFDQGLGQIFTVRVAGNIVDPATVASIEYAVEHLNAKLIVVMGHESCGAVKAALNTPPGTSAGSRDLDVLISAIRPNLGSERTPASQAKTLRGPVKSNAGAVAEDLVIRSKIIRSYVDRRKVAIVPAIYSLESGHVEFWHTDAVE